MAATAKELMQRRLAALKAERASWWPHWREISDHLLPRAGRYFVGDRNRGDKRHNNILDSTATRSLRILASGMMAGMTSPARPWFRLTTSDKSLDKLPQVEQWLADVTDLMLQVFARSNTYRALHACYEELAAFGTWSDVVLPDFERVIHHHALTVGEYCIAQDFQGTVDTLYREFEAPVSAVVREFGRDKCSLTVQRLFDDGQLDAWVPLVHGIERRAERDQRRRDARNMPWRSAYYEVGADNDALLRDGGFKRFPALCPRWDIAGGDIYGNSPAMEALGDIKQLQHQQLSKGRAIDYQVRPPVTVPIGLKNREVDLLPGGVSYVDMPGKDVISSAYEVRLDLNHLLLDMQDVRQRITRVFSADLFLMISSDQDRQMTATEVAARQEEKMLMLGPVLERLHNELLDPMIEQTFDRLVEAGALPPPPQELAGRSLNVQLISMLAQAQRAIGLNSMDRFVSSLGVVAQIKPDVLDKFNQDEWAEVYADRVGLDPQVIVAGKDLAVIRDARAKAQQQAAMVTQAEQAASAAAKLGTVSTGPGQQDNAAAGIMAAFSGYT